MHDVRFFYEKENKMENCYKIGEIDQYQFYAMPKILFTNRIYDPVSVTAKVIYTLLRDRMSLSRKNRWCDEDGSLYLYFKQEDICKALRISRPTCNKSLKQLEQYGLIKTVRQGRMLPNKVYIMKLKNLTSECKEFLHNDVKKIDTNNTEISNTEIIDTKTNRARGSKKTVESVINDFVGNNEELREAVEGFIEMRKAIKKPLTVRALAMGLKTLKKLSGDDESLMIKICDQSTVNCWQGFYELKPEKSAEQIKAEIERKKKEEERQRMIAEITF